MPAVVVALEGKEIIVEDNANAMPRELHPTMLKRENCGEIKQGIGKPVVLHKCFLEGDACDGVSQSVVDINGKFPTEPTRFTTKPKPTSRTPVVGD